VGALDLRRFTPGAVVRAAGAFHRNGDPRRDPKSVLSTLASPIGSVVDKARIALLAQRLLHTDPADILRGADLTTANDLRNIGFSPRMIERFLQPLFAGIQLDPALAASSRMFRVLLRTLAAGDAAVPSAGMQAIPDQLASRLPIGTITFGAKVERVTPSSVRLTDGSTVRAAGVVVAVEGPAAAHLLGMPDRGSLPVSCVYFAAPDAPLPDRAIILDGERSGPAVNVAIMSNVSPTYAPPGRALIAAACPGTMSVELEADVRRQMTCWFGPQVESWHVVDTYRIAHAQPSSRPPFNPKRAVRLGRGLYVCGDHRDTPSIQGALFSGRRTAEAIMADRR
jgi:phytoene dehydrogenase-like protein